MKYRFNIPIVKVQLKSTESIFLFIQTITGEMLEIVFCWRIFSSN